MNNICDKLSLIQAVVSFFLFKVIASWLIHFMEWIKHPLKFTGNRVTLAPLEERHFEALIKAGENKAIWAFNSFDGSDGQKLTAYLKEFLELRNKKEQYPFVVI